MPPKDASTAGRTEVPHPMIGRCKAVRIARGDAKRTTGSVGTNDQRRSAEAPANGAVAVEGIEDVVTSNRTEPQKHPP